MKLEKILATTIIGLTLMTGCTTENTPQKPLHKNCYGLHVKENPNNIMVEFYKEGWQQFKEPVTDTVYIQITKDNITYTQGGHSKTYELEMHPENTPR
jgi:hypothetical protein